MMCINRQDAIKLADELIAMYDVPVLSKECKYSKDNFRFYFECGFFDIDDIYDVLRIFIGRPDLMSSSRFLNFLKNLTPDPINLSKIEDEYFKF